MDKFYSLVEAERRRQDELHGETNQHMSVPANALTDWTTILGEEYGELCKAIIEFCFQDGSLDNVEKECVHVAAVAKAIWEDCEPEVE